MGQRCITRKKEEKEGQTDRASPLPGRGRERREKGRAFWFVHPKFRVKGCPPSPCTGEARPPSSPAPPLSPPVPQIGSYYGSEITAVDIDGDGVTDVLLVGAPMYFSEGRERGRVYVYNLRQVLLWGHWQPPRGTWSLPSPWFSPGKLGPGEAHARC